jgi:hypothetical protein
MYTLGAEHHIYRHGWFCSTLYFLECRSLNRCFKERLRQPNTYKARKMLMGLKGRHSVVRYGLILSMSFRIQNSVKCVKRNHNPKSN